MSNFKVGVVSVLACCGLACAVHAQQQTNPSGLPVWTNLVDPSVPFKGGYSSRGTCPCSGSETAENEADCGIPADLVNGGCNSTPNVFGSIAMGESVCGTAQIGTNNLRDTDWFRFTITETTSVEFNVVAEFPVQVLLLSDACPTTALAAALGNACTDTAARLPNLAPGSYIAFVSPQQGSVFFTCDSGSTGYVGTLRTYVPPPPPANDNCADATDATAGGNFPFDTTSASNDAAGSCGASAASPDVWFKVSPTMSGTLIASTCGTAGYDTVLAVYDSCGGTEIVCLDDFCGLQTQISFAANAGSTYWIRVAGYNNASGSGTISITPPQPPPANDNCADAVAVSLDTPVDFNTISATNDSSPSCNASTGGDVWFRFTAAAAGSFRAATCGSALDTVVSVYDGCGGTELVCNDDACGLQSRADFAASAGQQVWIRVGGYNAAVGAGSLTISSITPPWNEDGDAGDLPDTAQAPQGSGSLGAIAGTLDPSDVDMYRIRICDFANFSATTVGGVAFDSQLFLFNTDGMGVSFNDDSQATTQSTLTSQFVTADGEYLLALSGYNRDATDSSGNIIWANTPFGTERQPDGPGAASPVAGWVGTGGGGAYTIELTGTCYPGGSPRCIADVDDGSGSGTPDGGVTIDDLLYYLVIYSDGNVAADVDNGTFTGTQDGGVTIDDLLYYLFRYGEGC